MTRLTAVDPGKHKCGVAWFVNGVLTQVAHSSVQNISGADQVIVELPDRVTGSTLRDVLELRDVAARVRLLGEQSGASVRAVAAGEWKGTTPKPKHHRRLWSELNPDEQTIVAAFAKRSPEECSAYIEAACLALALGEHPSYGWGTHNVLDAVGLGLWHLGRVDKAGNPAGKKGKGT